ncbi:MAG TPA: hypothetical protein PK113_02640 [Bacillota bacterium]|nr:hypothetical protein [Bacillota bacterium]
MEKIIKEYNQWLKDNQHFILHLRDHDSTLYTRISPVYEVLNFLAEETDNNGLDFNEDINKIFQIGLEYLHSQIQTCKLYFENTFKNDFHTFIDYDVIISYILYLEDLRYEMIENKINYKKASFDKLVSYLEDLMTNKKIVPENINLYVDSEVHKIVDTDDWNFQSIIDIFVQIAETLGIELYIENEYIIGKDV